MTDRAIDRVVDHLVYATRDLDASVRELAERLGVHPSAGGQHLGRGTRNALLALGPTCYLEIVGPDASQPAPVEPRWFGIDQLDAPQLITWAAAGVELPTWRERASRAGVPLGDLAAGSRQRPDGVTLAWQLTNPRAMLADGIVPFFIDWGTSPHPAAQAAAGVRLVELRAEHPAPAPVIAQLRALDLTLSVSIGPRPALIAIVEGPRGRVELR